MKNFFRTRAGKILLFLSCAAAAFFLFYFALGLLRGSMLFTAKNHREITEICRDQLQADARAMLIRDKQRLLQIRSQSGNVPEFVHADGNFQYFCLAPVYTSSLGVVYNALLCSTEYRYIGTDILMLFWITNDGSTDVTFEAYLDSTNDFEEYLALQTFLTFPVIVRAQLLPGLPYADAYRNANTVYSLPGARLDQVGLLLPAAILLGLLTILLYVLLACVSARRPNTEEIVPGLFNRLPFELLLLGAASLLLLSFYLERTFCAKENTLLGFSNSWLGERLLTACCALLLTGLYMSAAARIKQKNLLKNTVLYRLLYLVSRPFAALGRLLRDAFRKLTVIWKAALAILLAVLLNVALACRIFTLSYTKNTGIWLVLLILFDLLLVCGALALVWQFRKLKKAGEKLAAGELNYQVPTGGMVFDLKALGEDLNRIGSGINRAVEERTKAERMKTELISNVSHDLKTPLTSIINYTDLLQKEDSLSGQGREAVEVLLRQSGRLKRLIEDLVEASKASSGTLEVELQECDAAVFVTQTAGEYEERLSAAGLQLITRVPDRSLRILADGRRMWRIFDNLMNNISKYSLPGSRVYLDLMQKGNRAVFLFKNTSREPLNISAEELMERFVRGDSSRHTEGNGLGLAIAKSLAELQDGTFQIQIDGDLFKAILSFPLETGSET